MSVHTRLPEIDALRGAAIIAMVAFHLWFSLWWFGLADSPFSGWGRWFGQGIGLTFLLVSGVSNYLFSRKHVIKSRLIIRVVKLACAACTVSIVTAIVIPTAPVYFGILHLMTVGCLTVWSTRHWSNKWLLVLAMLLIGLGWCLYGQVWPTWWGVPIGFQPVNFLTLDYYPICPWLGWLLIGVIGGRWLYPEGHRGRALTKISNRLPVLNSSPLGTWIIKILSWFGIHSLAIYITHQVIIWLVLYAYVGVLG